MVGATFTSLDDQSCVPLTILEVPCDIRDVANNCIWEKKKNQCGPAVVTEVKSCTDYKVAGNASIPIPASTKDDQQIILNTTVAIESKI